MGGLGYLGGRAGAGWVGRPVRAADVGGGVMPAASSFLGMVGGSAVSDTPKVLRITLIGKNLYQE